MSKKFKIKQIGKKYAYGAPIIKFEKKCFDWHCIGREKETVDDGYEVTETSTHYKVRHKSHIVKTIWFERPACYKKNFLFVLTEILSNIVSFFRVLALNLIVPAIIVCIIIMAGGDEGSKAVTAIALVYAGLIGLSLILGGLGYLWKKVFKLTEKNDQYLAENGYEEWSNYEVAE